MARIGIPCSRCFHRFLPIQADRIPAPRSFRPTLDALEDELDAPSHAHRFVLAQLFLILFVDALRMHMLELAWNDRGWFRALVDPSLQAPLQAAARIAAACSLVTSTSSSNENHAPGNSSRIARVPSST